MSAPTSKHLNRTTRSTALVAGAGLAVLALIGNSAAQAAPRNSGPGSVAVVNTETVSVYLSPLGDVESARVYEQLSFTGIGEVTVENPIEESGLRNLDEFGGYDVTDGVQTTTVDVDGAEHVRSVSTYTRDLPLEIGVDYLLDGVAVQPGDVVGATGNLTVTYTVKNVTGVPQEITYPDGEGNPVTSTAVVPIPLVGSLTTVAPAAFTDVRSDQANMAGDGKGGTKLSFTMTLFPPIGSDTAVFGYTADIRDGIVPEAAVTVLPVNPLDSPSFKAAGESYQGGAETGRDLVAGATEIDTNLLKLRDGAGTLLAGLIQLSDGADELEAGLVGKAAPGADRLAAGAGDLDAGLTRLDAGARALSSGAGDLDAGAGKLGAGAGKLSDGTTSALAGGKKLSAGLQQISGGLDQLADAGTGLPAANAGIDALKAGVDQILAGFGTTSQSGTLLNGLARLEAGLGELRTGSAQLAGGLGQLRGDGSAGNPGLVAAKGGVDQVQAGLDAAVKDGGSLDQLVGALQGVQVGVGCTGACGPTLAAIIDQVRGNKAALGEGNVGLKQVSGGLGQAIGALDTQLIPGAGQINAGLGDALAGATQAKAGAGRLQAGVLEVSAGLDQLQAGLGSAISGVLQLANGADAAVDGSGDLVDGLGLLDAGAGALAAGSGDLVAGTGRLAAGAEELAAGAGTASDGSGLLAAGAEELAGGLGAAADGSGRLADGLSKAAASAPALGDGAQRLSVEGMSQLVEAGSDTALNYGELYSVMSAGAQRADEEKMAYGAPEQAMGLTAYSFNLQGADGEGSRNWQRGLGGLALLGAGFGLVGLRRRLGL
ncbi:hypothetical protein [Nocardioides sp.]|uniref:hypothetical protein n=1 Tax=Nocardioides sp. TaxID=35761 RepID=UPI003567F326